MKLSTSFATTCPLQWRTQIQTRTSTTYTCSGDCYERPLVTLLWPLYCIPLIRLHTQHRPRCPSTNLAVPLLLSRCLLSYLPQKPSLRTHRRYIAAIMILPSRCHMPASSAHVRRRCVWWCTACQCLHQHPYHPQSRHCGRAGCWTP